MVFSSLEFLFGFLPITLLLYYISPMKIKNLILMVSGLLFYAWGEPFYVLIMIISILIDYSAGLIMHKHSENKKIRTTALIFSVVSNIGLLSVFKYSSFVIQNISSVFGVALDDPHLPLPIGISFFTFQSMSYTIDLYRNNINVQKNIIAFASYVTLFPQIIAGPIVRYATVASEIDNRDVNTTMVADGIAIFVKGLAKKVLLANTIGAVWSDIKLLDYQTLSPITAWVGILAFTFQIYYDFSGYSDMAIGLGKMLGFTFPKNFEHPYVSRSISEFWRRWHITLGDWFRNYVYIPLGGNKKGLVRTIINLAIVWFLTGLWHGASWNFIVWGLYFGLLIIIERLFLLRILTKLPKFLSTSYTFVMVVFGWVIFETTSLTDSWHYIKSMLGLTSGWGANANGLYYLVSNLAVFVVCVLCSNRWFARTEKQFMKTHFNSSLVIRYITTVAMLLVCIVFMATTSYNPFLYLNF